MRGESGVLTGSYILSNQALDRGVVQGGGSPGGGHLRGGASKGGQPRVLGFESES